MRLIEAGIDVGIDAVGPVPGAETPAEPATETSQEPSTIETVPTHAPASTADRLAPAGTPATLPSAWQAAWDEALSEAERQLITFASSLDLDPPVVGEEFGPGVPLDVAWPQQRTAFVVEDLSERDRTALEGEGWTIIRIDEAGAHEALEAVGGSAS